MSKQRGKDSSSGDREERAVEGVTEINVFFCWGRFHHLEGLGKNLLRKINTRKRTAMCKGIKVKIINNNIQTS